MQIIGAGLAGLITACKIKSADIFEAGPCVENHKALLRFRDKSVSDLTGIPFEEVTVNKEIYYHGETHHRCTVAMANHYSFKVAGAYRGRSIWNLDPVQRYVAPDDFYGQLVDKHSNRIAWSTPIKDVTKGSTVQRINTAPLPVIMQACGLKPIEQQFAKSHIKVDRYRLPHGTKLYQTIYFPSPTVRLFRASVTGDLLIVESVTGQPRAEFQWTMDEREEFAHVLRAFGFYPDYVEKIESVEQKYGKIIDLPREQREAILYELTRDFNVFSIGRFATWRNILLDDVAKDIEVVERLMASSAYGRQMILSGR